MYSEDNKLIINDDNYFDLAEALHAWLSLYHTGQGSIEYNCLSRSQFKPDPMWSESEVERENYFFDEINRIEPYYETFNRLEQFLKDK